MCGIGALSRSTPSGIPDGITALQMMALGLEERGQDATGFAWTTRGDGWPYYWKEDDTAGRAAWRAPLDPYIATAIVHTRFATQGRVDDLANDHPIVLPGILLVHNGIVTNDDELFDVLNCERRGAVDSEAIAALLTYGGDALDDEDPASLLELVEGDAALAWITTDETDVVHLARLRERPLVLAWTRQGDLLAASTHSAIRHAAIGEDIVEYETVPEGTYLKVRGGEIIHTAKIYLPSRVTRKYYGSTTYTGTTRYTTSDGVTWVKGADGAWDREDPYAQDELDELAEWWARHADDEPTPRDELLAPSYVTSLEQYKRDRAEGSERGPGGELVVTGTGSPERTFQSELALPVDGSEGS